MPATSSVIFHGVGPRPAGLDPGEARYWVSADLFRATVERVAACDDVTITFDDGNRSDVDVALPILLEHGLRANFFVCAGRLSDPRYLAVADLHALRAAGMGVGSHGMHHVPWRGLDDAALDEEVRGSRVVLEDALGAPVREAGLPFGAYDRRVLGRARRAGYTVVWTSDTGRALGDGWLRPRTSVTATDDPDDLLRRARARTPKLFAKRVLKALR